MSDNMHIDRIDENGEQSDEGILADEWVEAVNKIEGLRIAGKSDSSSSPDSVYDVEVYDKGDQEWIRIFYWRGTNATFKFAGYGDPDFPYIERAFELADVLGAAILDPDWQVLKKEDFEL